MKLSGLFLIIAVCLHQNAFGYRLKEDLGPESVICERYEHGDKIPNPIDCSSFYVCDRGFPELVECSQGLLFDVDFKVCNWPEETTCVLGSTPFKSSDVHADDAADNTHFEHFGHHFEHHFEIHEPVIADSDLEEEPSINVNDVPTVDIDTLVPVAVFPPFENVVNTAEDQENEENPPEVVVYLPDIVYDPNNIHCHPEGVYYLPHPDKCQFYYLCVSGTLHKNFCGLELFWDFQKQRCDATQTAACYAKLDKKPELLLKPQVVSSASERAAKVEAVETNDSCKCGV